MPVRDSLPNEDFVMPVWMEILLNVMAYAGFIAIATVNPSWAETAARQASGPNGVS